MINKKLRNEIINNNKEKDLEVIFFDNPSFYNSIVGVSVDGAVIYDLNKMIEEITTEDKISYEEALEFIEYNTLRALPYYKDKPGCPIILEKTIDDLI